MRTTNIESLKAAEQLGDSYKAAYEEISNLRRSINRTEGRPEAAPRSDPDVQQDAQHRVAQFKNMLADRRAAALAAFSAEDEGERVAKLQEMLADCKAPPPQELHAEPIPEDPPSPDVSASADQAIQRALGADKTSSVFDKLMDAGRQTKAKIDEKRQTQHDALGGGQGVQAKPGDLAVVNRLTRAHQESRARLDEARRAKNVEERNQCRDPQISKKAQELSRGGSVGDRLLQYGKDRAERLAAQEQKHKQAMEEEVVGQPKINQKSQRLDRNVDMYFAWEARKKLRVQQQQEQQKAAEVAEVKSVPTISRNSARIVKQMKRATRIEEQLLTHGQIKSAKKLQEQALAEEQLRNKRTPRISVHSAALERPGNVCDRLYMLAQEKQERQQVRTQYKEAEELARPPEKQPRPRAKSQGRVRTGERVEDRLLAKGDRYKQKADARAKAVRSHEVCTTKPRVGPYSQLLVELMEKRTGSTASKRLQQPTRQLKRSTLQDLEEEELNMTFQPQLNRNSRSIDQRHNPEHQDRRDLLFQRADEYEFRRARLQEQHMKKEMEECTFNPQIPENNQRARAGAAAQDDGFIERNMKWLRQRDRQREASRHDTQRKTMEECSFTPNLARTRPVQTPGTELREWDDEQAWEDEQEWEESEDPVMAATRQAWAAADAQDDAQNEPGDEQWEREQAWAQQYQEEAYDDFDQDYDSPVRAVQGRAATESPFTDDESVFAVSSPDESPYRSRRAEYAEDEASDWINRAVGAASAFE